MGELNDALVGFVAGFKEKIKGRTDTYMQRDWWFGLTSLEIWWPAQHPVDQIYSTTKKCPVQSKPSQSIYSMHDRLKFLQAAADGDVPKEGGCVLNCILLQVKT
jgi:hypothetical protein